MGQIAWGVVVSGCRARRSGAFTLHPGCSLPELFFYKNPIDILYLFLFLRPVPGYAQLSLMAS